LSALDDSLALEYLDFCERDGLLPSQLPCTACGSWIAADATICPECDADPRLETDPCEDCEEGTVGERFGGIFVDRRSCLACKGTHEIPRSSYDSRADIVHARKLRSREEVARAA
jgi:hypothetical protein